MRPRGDWVTNEEIELVCSYMKDDQAVANYFGIQRARVEGIRAHMRNNLPRWINRSVHCPQNESLGVNSHIVARDEAELGSRELNERIHGLFRNFAGKHGIDADEARILLLDTGVRL